MAGFDKLFGSGKDSAETARKVYVITVISGGAFFAAAFVILKFL